MLATTSADGRPWATPVFFAPLRSERGEVDRLCWVSSPDGRHSRNLAVQPALAITVFDSTARVGGAEAAYFEAEAALADAAEVASALNERLPQGKGIDLDDLRPGGALRAYVARIRRRYVLVRGGDPEYGNEIDTTVEVG